MSSAAGSNDRLFACSINACGGITTPLGGSPASNNFLGGLTTLDLNFIDVDGLRTNIAATMADVEQQYANILKYVDYMELQTELSYQAKTIDSDLTLFNKIAVAISEIKKLKKTLKLWIHDFRDNIASVLEKLNSYHSTETVIKSIKLQTTLVSGLPQSKVSLAKQTLSRNKALGRNVTRLSTLTVQITGLFSELQQNLNGFYNGRISIDGDTVSLQDFNEIFGELTNNQSPLLRVQKDLSALILKNPTSVTLAETNVPPLTPGGGNQPGILTNLLSDDKPLKSILTNLQEATDHMLYASKRDEWDNIFENVLARAQTTLLLGRIQAEIDKFKYENTPARLITTLQTEERSTANDNSLYLLRERLIRIIANISGGDEIYRQAFEQILAKVQANAELFAVQAMETE